MEIMLPYVPLPSGKLCVAVSTRFPDAAGQQHIVCLHMPAPPIGVSSAQE